MDIRRLELKKKSEKELKEMLKDIDKRDKEIKEAIKTNKELIRLRKQEEECEKKIEKLDKKIKRIKDKIGSLVLTSNEVSYYPYINDRYWEKTNIRDEIFEAIRKAGFRTSKLLNTQIVDFANFLLRKLEEGRKDLSELEKKRNLLENKREEIWEREIEIEERIKEKINSKYPNILRFSRYDVEKELERRKEAKKDPKKAKLIEEIELEREKFKNSFDKVFEIWKKIMKL